MDSMDELKSSLNSLLTNTQKVPAVLFVKRIDFFIPVFIFCVLGTPIICIALGDPAMNGTEMPEARINENYHFILFNRYIWFAEKGLSISSKTKAALP